jgi:hypothetical protein
MIEFNIDKVAVNQYHQIYDDLISATRAALLDLGYRCSVRVNAFTLGTINILIGSTIFSSRYQELPKLLGGRPSIVYQLEPLDETHGLLKDWPEYWELLQHASAIWEYSPSNLAFLKANAIENVYYLPPGHHRALEMFLPDPDPDLDVLFIGSPHPRRDRVLEELERYGLRVANAAGLFGKARNRFIARSKIVLNIHAWDSLMHLETVRLSFLLSNHVFVLSEQGDHNPYENGVVYTEYRSLVDRCIEFSRQPREARDHIARAGYHAVRKIDMTANLQHALEAIDNKGE